MSRARTIRHLTLGLAALLALSSCALPVHRRTVQAPQPGPALTIKEAAAVLAAYEAGSNAAGTGRSAPLIAKHEVDPVLALTAASYRVNAKVEPSRPHKPFYHPDAKFFIPRQLSYPHWFVVQAASGYDRQGAVNEAATYVVFVKASAAQPWRVTLGLDPDEGSKEPKVAVDAEGYATAVPAAARLAVAPGGLAKAHADVLARGPASPNSRLFAADASTTEFRADNAKQVAQLKNFATVRYDFSAWTDRAVYALKTSDGGALVFYATQDVLTILVTGSNSLLKLAPTTAVLSGKSTAYYRLVVTRYLQFVAVVPKKGKVTVLGGWGGAVEAEAS